MTPEAMPKMRSSVVNVIGRLAGVDAYQRSSKEGEIFHQSRFWRLGDNLFSGIFQLAFPLADEIINKKRRNESLFRRNSAVDTLIMFADLGFTVATVITALNGIVNPAIALTAKGGYNLGAAALSESLGRLETRKQIQKP